MADSNQRILGGTGHTQIAGNQYNSNHYYAAPTSDAIELGVIGEVFSFVTQNIDACKQYKKSKPDTWVQTQDKMRINFSAKDCEAIEQLYYNALPKMKLIESYFQKLDEDQHDDLHNYFYELYLIHRSRDINPMMIFSDLITSIIPPNRQRDPQYRNIAMAMVMMFFEDCTIFEKTVTPTLWD
ncbi:hypothetical protein [Solirubrum puertoriconensis]|uniref:Uncharacterized protein n=1 Tax=Solirubrum puertoriconensis TaxID=1751427 RepID=A0A9X0HJ92_SOLP1|nr:hypothetical protein [Solirubrum puertoriconensis]KUG06912.1 hypothetical protein ASU33_06195 [Solirubrum puertoriconensis]